MWLPVARVAVRRCHTVGNDCNAASALPMCQSCLKNTFINRLEKHTYMNTTFVLASGCANGLQMPALERHCCSNSDCNVDALWYAAQMHGFCTGCCGVRTSLQHLCCNRGSTVMRNVDAAVVHSVRNIASTVFCDCIADDAASVHHRACSLRCKVIAPCVAMLSSSAASAKQYWCGSFALMILLDADMRDTDVRGFFGIAGGCVSHDALTAVVGEIPERARICFNDYLQCADATASGGSGYSVGIAHTSGGKCADTLSFPNFKATASQEIRRLILKPHAESTERILWNTNHTNVTKGNVGSRLGATEWTHSITRFFRTSREVAKSAKRDSLAAPHICPNSASSAAGQIMPLIPNKRSENARKSLAGCGGRLSKSLWNGVGADTPIESRCSHKGLPSDTVFFR